MQGRGLVQRMRGRETRGCSLGRAREPMYHVSSELPSKHSGEGYLSKDPENCSRNTQGRLADERRGGQVEWEKNKVPDEVLTRH